MFGDTSKGHIFKEIQVLPLSKTNIQISKKLSFRGKSQSGNAFIKLYPSITDIPEGGLIEVYMYYPEIIKDGELHYLFKQAEGVSAYYIETYYNNKAYFTLSLDNSIDVNYNKIEQIKPLELMLADCEHNDITYNDPFLTKLASYYDYSILKGGYIVKSNFYKEYIWLEPER
jgi:hypothetical protein